MTPCKDCQQIKLDQTVFRKGYFMNKGRAAIGHPAYLFSAYANYLFNSANCFSAYAEFE